MTRKGGNFMKRGQRGQVTVEVAILFIAVVAALFFMAVYVQRGMQGGVRGSADSLGSQFQTTNAWTMNVVSTSTEIGKNIGQLSNSVFNQDLQQP